MSKKICLFTAHTPTSGGGSVILRSLIKNLPALSVSWKYVAADIAPGYEEGYLGHGLMGGSIIKDVWQSWHMLSERSSPLIDQLVRQLIAVDCEGYWIVSHNEGLSVALALTRVQQERPVHLTVHDDWAGALCARSWRYRLMESLARQMTIDTIKKVTTFDVISRGMQSYYQQLTGRQGAVCHRYLPADAIMRSTFSKNGSTSQISVGHIGSIYDKEDFFDFLDLLGEFAHAQGKQPVVHLWGSTLSNGYVPAKFKELICFHANLPEEQVIPKLACCSFVYCMYPMADRLRCFSQTSLPTKLTSYVQAGRPIFGHGPADSTLADFLHTTGTGVLWQSADKAVGMAALADVMMLDPNETQWQTARDDYFGERNLLVMQELLGSSSP